MNKLSHLAQAMHLLLSIIPVEAATQTGFVKRRCKLSGPRFAQTLVFGWMSNPDATLEELSQTASALGFSISPQGLDKRFTKEAADFFFQLLQKAVNHMISGEAVACDLLNRFKGVYLLDGSTIALPPQLATEWRGCGGCGSSSALKLQVRFELSRAVVEGPILCDGKQTDSNSHFQHSLLPAGSLRIGDLGYWNIQVFQQINATGGFWLSRLHTSVGVFSETGEKLDLVNLLKASQQDGIELKVKLGADQQMDCRLIAQRVPEEVAAERRRKIRRKAQKSGETPSAKRLALAGWTIYVTNVESDKLSQQEVLIMGRARWQVELLFKLWKSHGRIDESRSSKAWRIMSEVYAKMVAMIIKQWVMLISCWARADRSLMKAVKTIQRHALHIASKFRSSRELIRALEVIKSSLERGCRINKRKKKPSTYQLLQGQCEGSLG